MLKRLKVQVPNEANFLAQGEKDFAAQLGKFRTDESGATIDASSSLPGGAEFSGPSGLKKVLMERREQFVECLAEKLLTFGLGRGLEYYDLPAVREIRRETARGEYRFSSLVLAIVNSVPFQMRRVPAT